MKKNNIKWIVLIIIAFVLFENCGQVLPGGNENIKDKLAKARKNLVQAESIQDIVRKKGLLNNALNLIKQAETINEKEKKMTSEVVAGYAYYNYVLGNNTLAKKYCKDALKRSKHSFLITLNTRILLKEKGKKYANEAERTLQGVIKRYPAMSMAHLTLGDTYYLIGNFREALKYYKNVMIIGKEFVANAADRLEDLYQIEITGIDTGKVQNILFSKSIKRDEVANILHKVFHIEKHLKFGKGLNSNFNDLSKSLYADSILALRKKGFFSYIEGEKFEPFQLVSRSELSKIIEDFIAIKTGNDANRKRYMNDKVSPIKGIKVNDAYYNSIRLSIDNKIMDLPLDGSINPYEPISGMETIITMRKLVEKYAKKKKK